MEMTKQDVAEALRVSVSSVNAWAKAGDLRGGVPRGSKRLGYVFMPEDVRAFAATDLSGVFTRRLSEWFAAQQVAV